MSGLPFSKIIKLLGEGTSTTIQNLVGKPLVHLLQQVDKKALTGFFSGVHRFASDGIMQLCVLCSFNAIVPSLFVLRKKETAECTRQDKIYDASRVFCNDIVAMAIIAGNALLLKKAVAPLFTSARATKNAKALTERFFSAGSTIISDFLLIPYATTLAIHYGLNPVLHKLGVQTGEKPEAVKPASSATHPLGQASSGLNIVSSQPLAPPSAALIHAPTEKNPKYSPKPLPVNLSGVYPSTSDMRVV